VDLICLVTKDWLVLNKHLLLCFNSYQINFRVKIVLLGYQDILFILDLNHQTGYLTSSKVEVKDGGEKLLF